MGDAWVYIDESQAPEQGGTEKGHPFWVAAVITEKPIPQELLDDALVRLRDDPDSAENGQDGETLRRGYFHASEDSKNAHSWICRAIVDGAIDAEFSATQWFFEGHEGEGLQGSELHQHAIILSALAAIESDFDCIHILIAERTGTFQDSTIASWPQLLRAQQLGSVIQMPTLPARFPRIEAELVGAGHPGIQVSDFALWAVQRAKPLRLRAAGNSDWIDRLGLRLSAGGGIEGHAHQMLDGELGKGIGNTFLPPTNGPALRPLKDLGQMGQWLLAKEIAADVHRAARISQESTRIGHLATELTAASASCELAHQVGHNALGETLAMLMEAFLLVCDTLPVYDVHDAAAWVRAAEKRTLAAEFLKEPKLWVPRRFSLQVGLGP